MEVYDFSDRFEKEGTVEFYDPCEICNNLTSDINFGSRCCNRCAEII